VAKKETTVKKLVKVKKKGVAKKHLNKHQSEKKYTKQGR
jgi:hypothetical protein